MNRGIEGQRFRNRGVIDIECLSRRDRVKVASLGSIVQKSRNKDVSNDRVSTYPKPRTWPHT